MANDVADFTSSVVIQSGTVTISGTASVSIVGTPTVSISGTPTVNVGNTPAVTINSGSVTATISGTPNINIQSQSVTVAVNLPWRAVGSKTTVSPGADSFTTSAVGTGAQTLQILIEGGSLTALTRIKVVGGTTGTVYEDQTAGVSISITGLVTLPIQPAADSTYTISWVSSSGSPTVAAFASDQIMGYPSLGQENEGASVPVVLARDNPGGVAGPRTGLNSQSVVAPSDMPSSAIPPFPVTIFDNISPNQPNQRNTYLASVDIVLAASATDIFVIGGSATKTIRVTRIEVNITATTAAATALSLVKRSTADTGGTATAATRVPADRNAIASASDVVVQGYTANPTTGTAVGVVGRRRDVAVVSPNLPLEERWIFGTRPGSQAITLRGVADQLAVNLNGASLTGGDASIEVEWTEE